ncbi:hypothetical protein I6J18_20005 [Peribacillus psychrosaccharolyticus]|uniref:Uncharacterized protein n=1 Tax=Peribacillus psychrosaccharolyticus TaxID=1407 RepID=A0A974NLD4_PERPY|nr:hypothetical protein [Peribacillus psychrosaccharolyticus]MEC2054407.1 hypothetical protein [Peribacillus psychrosaccharolyticus]MED3744365.1 hypothetical protein [Peribacillus psychrosaccharolyticus]QQS99841.1 hypothetical protein I6J18_20005 [Peribacillus psychrosaccharolyticus]
MDFLGKYKEFPQTLQMLTKIDLELQKEGVSLFDQLSLFLLDDDYSYDVTPYDVIPFANIGADGIHYGFLTDFGRVKDLEEAFIVCISPMNFGNHVQIIARNIKEFIDVVLTLNDASSIENLLDYSTKEEYRDFLDWMAKDAAMNPEFTEQSPFICERIQQKLNRKPIDDLYEYVEVIVPEQRKKLAPINTFDTLGVVSNHAGHNQEIFPMNSDSIINLKELKSFFKRNENETKLATIRNLQFFYLIQDDDELKGIVKAEMQKMGLIDEVNRMEL